MSEGKLTPTPWCYRPHKHDDWGWIRGPVMEGEEIGELVAKAHCWTTEEERDVHRREKTDPYSANAEFIVRAVNSHDALVMALEDAALQIEYLHKKFQPTGSGNASLARIRAALAAAAPPVEAKSEVGDDMTDRAKNCTYGNPDCPKCNPA